MPGMRLRDHDSLVEKLRQCLATRSDILEAYLFGSRGRRDAQSHSDVDVAVFLDADPPPQSPFGYAADLTAELTTALSVQLRRRGHPQPRTATAVPPGVEGWRSSVRPGRCGHDDPGGPRPFPLLRLPAATAKDGCDTRCADCNRKLRPVSPGALDSAVIRRHLLSLDAALQTLRKHQGGPVDALRGEPVGSLLRSRTAD